MIKRLGIVINLVLVLNLVGILIGTNSFADEQVIEFEEQSLPVFNEELRKIQDDRRDSDIGVQSIVTIADGDVTPDVNGGTVFITSSNTGATEITDLDNPRAGQIIYLIGGSADNSSTISDGANFKLSGAWTGSVDEVLVLYVKEDNYYIELSRSTN